jgi:esterase/lipase superfamily enzyme
MGADGEATCMRKPIGFRRRRVSASSPNSNEAMGEMKLAGIKEIGRFPEVPYPAVVDSAGYRRAPAVVAAHEEAVAALQGEIRRRLAKTERKEVVVFIHGYNNTFSDAANATGNICRLLGGNSFAWC